MTASRSRPSPGVLRTAGRVGLGVTAGQLVVLLSSPILSRLYEPSAFGVFAVLTAIESVLVVAAALRLEQAMTLPRSDGDGINLLAAALAALCAFTTVAAMVLWALADQIAGWTSTEAVADHLLLVPLVLLVDGLCIVLSFWAVRKRAYPSLATARGGQGFGQAGGQIALAPVLPNAAGLMVGVGVGRLVSVGLLARASLKGDRRLLSDISLADMRRVVARYRRFPLLGTWAALINSAGLQVPGLLVAGFFGPVVAGWFFLGTRIVALPVTLLGQAAAQTFQGHLSERYRDSRHGLGSEARHLAKRLFLLGLVPTAAFVALGPMLFEVVFGSEWTTAGDYVRILAVAYLMQFTVSPLAAVLVVGERQDVQLLWDVVRLIVVVASLAVPGLLGFSPRSTLAIFAAATVVMYAGLFVLVQVARPRSPDDLSTRREELARSV